MHAFLHMMGVYCFDDVSVILTMNSLDHPSGDQQT